MASNALTTAGRFGSSQASEPAGRGQRFPQIVVSAFRGPVQMHRAEVLRIEGESYRAKEAQERLAARAKQRAGKSVRSKRS
jgi:hypothetical protein